MAPWILVKHLAGPRAHRIDQFELADTAELVVGRSRAANIVFDGPREDTISRRHALIRVAHGDRPHFTVADLGSANGVRVNGKGIVGEQALGPGDIVELCPGGPAFSIAVEPDPPASDLPPPAVDTATERRRPRGNPLRYGRGAVLAAAIGATGLLLSKDLEERHPAPPSPAAVATPIKPAAPAAAEAPRPRPNPAAAIVHLSAQWRLYDRFTGKPVFQKVLSARGQRLPCFVDLGDRRIVPWLTTEDEDRTNIPITGRTEGTGFLVSAQGSLVTGKRLAAGWTAPYQGGGAWQGRAALFKLQRNAAPAPDHQLIELGTAEDGGIEPAAWIPADGAMLFHARVPQPLGAGPAPLDGRNDAISAVLGEGQDGLPARIIRLAADTDLAELRVDADAPLPAVELAAGAGTAGEAATIPGDGAAPVVAEDGTVLGIVVSTPTGQAYAYPATVLRALVQLP